jgi:DnaJ-domain-containing protein 1
VLTFRIGRHALADLAFTLGSRRLQRTPRIARARLDERGLSELRARLEGSGLHVEESGEARARLQKLRESYERYAWTIAHQLALELPDWLPAGEVSGNWRAAASRDRRSRALP